MPNRLSLETSPYLLQHAENPVDWFPWGEAAFDKAKREDKPVLLSVGYSACHWCHVMAHESFEDAATAELMNTLFVNVKVDREERPDVDALYMSAVQAMTGQGGWPMTVVMTPDGQPFFGGTYFPPVDKHGQPAFKRVLTSLAAAWQSQRDEVLASARKAEQYLQTLAGMSAQAALNRELLERAERQLQKRFDPVHGGFGDAPKFPPHSALRFLLLYGGEAPELALRTLRKMAAGGIYDQLGGGFARYSVDARWLVPHFEKMLYDNAQLAQRYTEAYALTGEPLYKRIAEETLDWVTRDMSSPEGGFYSALDADSDGEEGKFYIWGEAEFDEVLGEDSALAKRYYGLSPAGNFEGKTVLHVAASSADIKREFGLDEKALETKLEAIRTKLLKAREKRIRPGLDDKILTSWNGLMLAAFADAGRVFGRPDYVRVAKRNAGFLRDHLYRNGRLKHSYKNGEAATHGLLEDYAYFGLGLLALYRASFEPEWLELALELAGSVVAHFQDAEHGGFFSTADDAEALLARPKNHFDSPNPSENASAAELLLRLSRFTDDPTWESVAQAALGLMAEAALAQPTGFGTLLTGALRYAARRLELVIIGAPDAPDVRALLAEAERRGPPFLTVAVVQEGSSLFRRLPILQGKTKLKGRATAYLCERGSCQLPVTSPEALRAQLLALVNS